MLDIQTIIMFTLIYISLFCSIFFIITFFRGNDIPIKKLKKFPKVSILIAAYNEADNIAETIKSALRINYPNFEVIVIENGESTDGTYEIAKKFVRKGVRVFSIKKGGKGRALNYAIKRATGKFIVTMDADTTAEKNIFYKVLPYFSDPKVMSVTPSLKTKENKTALQKLQLIEYLFGIFYRKVFSILDALYVVPGAFTVYKKEFFTKHGGFDTNNITEDLEMTLRTHALGYKVKNALEAFIYTATPATFRDLTKQRLRWFLGMIENFNKYRRLFSSKYGFLGMVILPVITIALVLLITLFIFLIFSLINRILLWSPYLLGLFSLRPEHLKHLFNLELFYISLSSEFILGLFLLLLASFILIVIKRFAGKEYKIGPTFIFYLVVYTHIFVYWWFVTIAYKIAGRNVRFGGVVWNDSILQKLSDKIIKTTRV